MTGDTPGLSASAASLDLDHRADGTLLVTVAGRWSIHDPLPSPDEVAVRLAAASPAPHEIAFHADGLAGWDSGLLTFLVAVQDLAQARGIKTDITRLPPGIQRLLELATAVPEKKGARRSDSKRSRLAAVGQRTLAALAAGREMVTFIGEASLSLARLFTGRARYQRSDLWALMQETGARALPIVSLISILVGLILGFVGAIQLQQFGAQIFVANLVGIAMAREMGAMMSAIIMAGRTGAAFAAQLGTMQVNEEIDALRTLGISPMDFLVLPRMLALIVMLPLLCLYADLLGMIGGAIVGMGMLDISPVQYFYQTQGAVRLSDIILVVAKSSVFGVLIAFSGCLRGIQSGRSAAAVGEAATSAVVTAIVLIIVFDGLFAVVTSALGV